MSDTWTTHRSQVPQRSSGRIKGGVSTVQDERGPGLEFCCVFIYVLMRQSSVRGWRLRSLCVCLFWLLNGLNVRQFPPPSSRNYEHCYMYFFLIRQKKTDEIDRQTKSTIWRSCTATKTGCALTICVETLEVIDSGSDLVLYHLILFCFLSSGR